MKTNGILLLIIFIIAWIISIQFLKKFIHYSKKKEWFDLPDERKKHLLPTPSSGGIVFAVLILLLLPFIITFTPYFGLISAALFLLFIGLYDDRYDLSAKLKFAYQTLAIITAMIIIGPVELIDNNPFFLNEIISFLFILGFTNSFNLIDGVDGLAASYATVILIILTTLFLWNNDYQAALILSTIIGGLIGFLKFNWNNAKIFMGDTGSLFLGFVISTFAIESIKAHEASNGLSLTSDQLLIVLFAGLILPMVDTIRVMCSRLMNGKQPFKADRNHLHHILKKIGLSNNGVSVFFFITAITLIIISIFLIDMQFSLIIIAFALIVLLIITLTVILHIRIQQYKMRLKRYENSLSYIIKKNQLMRKHTPLTIKK